MAFVSLPDPTYCLPDCLPVVPKYNVLIVLAYFHHFRANLHSLPRASHAKMVMVFISDQQGPALFDFAV